MHYFLIHKESEGFVRRQEKPLLLGVALFVVLVFFHGGCGFVSFPESTGTQQKAYPPQGAGDSPHLTVPCNDYRFYLAPLGDGSCTWQCDMVANGCFLDPEKAGGARLFLNLPVMEESAGILEELGVKLGYFHARFVPTLEGQSGIVYVGNNPFHRHQVLDAMRPAHRKGVACNAPIYEYKCQDRSKRTRPP